MSNPELIGLLVGAGIGAGGGYAIGQIAGLEQPLIAAGIGMVVGAGAGYGIGYAVHHNQSVSSIEDTAADIMGIGTEEDQLGAVLEVQD